MSTIQTLVPSTGMPTKVAKLTARYSSLTPEKRNARLERLVDSDEGHSLELVDGELVEKGMGAKASIACSTLHFFLQKFNREHRLGYLLDAEATFKCFPTRKPTIRKPDISFIKKGRLPNEDIPDGHILIAPDLAIEFNSTHDRVLYLERKLEDYRQVGVLETWVVTTVTRSVLVCKKEGVRINLTGDSILTCEELLPGFALKISDIFE